jgi:hypothetical protein
VTTGPFAFRVNLEAKSPDWFAVQMQRLRKIYGAGSEILPRRACEQLGLSSTSLRRLTSQAVARGEMIRLGEASRTSYRLCAKS